MTCTTIFIYTTRVVILSSFLVVPVASGTNFTACLADLRKGRFGDVGGRDNKGGVVPVANATAIAYNVCKSACSAGPKAFKWVSFTQQFSAWLLPWLALISQLPFGAHDRLDNFQSALLTVGSPALAAYSLAFTVLNRRWLIRSFMPYNHPHSRKAVQILNDLQQSALRVSTAGHLLSSLIVHPQNDGWWTELTSWLDYTHTWSISAMASTSWVVLAYLFTVIDSFTTDIRDALAVSAHVGSVWLWLLPIVTCWLQISPKCDSHRTRKAVERANKLAYVTWNGRAVPAPRLSMGNAISLPRYAQDSLRCDEDRTPPIFNYARFFPWAHSVGLVLEVFRTASEPRSKPAHRHPGTEIDVEKRESRSSNGVQTAEHVEVYTASSSENTQQPDITYRVNGTWSRFVIASLLALFLQWGTVGGALVTTFPTPTRGLGCRSGSYLLYGVIGTAVWVLLVLSSLLSHFHTYAARNDVWKRLARALSICFRRLGKILAACNAVWLILACLYQFMNFFGRCWCNSSVLALGTAKAYNVIVLLSEDVIATKHAWIGGAVLSTGSAVVFIVLINLCMSSSTSRN